MGQDRKSPQKKPGLRTQAEARLQGQIDDVQEMSPEQLRELVHELQVHRIELELQNEELQRTQKLLAEATGKYSDFFDFAPVGFLALSQSGLIKEANLTACGQLGVSRDLLLDKPLRHFLDDDDLEIFRRFLQRVIKKEAPQACELRLKIKGGGWFYARLDGTAGKDIKGKRECRTAVTDISELKRVERQLWESQVRFTSFMGHLPSVAFIRDLQGRYLYVNPTLEKAFGRPREEWWGRTTEEMWPREVAEKFRAQDRLILETGKPLRVVATLPQADGLHQWIYDVFPIVNDQGQAVMIGTSALDVTDYFAAKEGLERLLAYGPAALYTCESGDPLAPTTYMSDNIQGLLGWKPRDFLADPGFWLDHIHPEDRPTIQAVMESPWPDDHQLLEYRFQAQDGTYHWMHDECKLLRDQDDKPLEINGVWIDITQRKQAEQERERAHHQLQTLIQAAPVAIISADREGRITGWNPAAERIFGWPAAEVIGRLNPIVPEDKLSEFRHNLGQQLAGKSMPTQELKRQRRDGTLIDISLGTAPLYDLQGEIVGAMAVIEDITQEKKVREALRESEAKFRASFDQAPIGAAIISLDYHFQQVNAELCRLTGYTAAELTSHTCLDLIHPEDRARAQELTSELIRGDQDHFQVDKRCIRKDSRILWGRLSARLVRDAAGQPSYLLTMMEDITAAKEAEEALKESENQYRLLVKQIPAVVFKGYSDCRVDFFDDKIEEVTGYAKEEFDSGMIRWCDLVLAEDRDLFKRSFRTSLKSDRYYVREYRIRKKDGEVRWVQGRGQILCTDAGGVDHVSGVLYDITELKALEAQLRHAQKMEAVGRLAGGVAHDFNNLLMTIMGYSELMRASFNKDDPLYQYNLDILKATERAAALTQQLLAFSRRQIMQPQTLNLNRVVADLEKMLRRLIGEDLELNIEAADDLGLVKADSGQLGQIIMNLIVNARDAMPQGGRLTLTTANVDFAHAHNCRLEMAPPGRYVMLAVGDTGGGMDETTLTHIFEPFFTTKENGKGTGLGLPMVYGIVSQSGGYIDVDSKPGQGTTFKVYLPRRDAEVEPPTTSRKLAAKLEGSETVLVVEDEDSLRTLLCRFFRLYGYKVLEARHGGEALLICEQHQGPIHLMVTDVVMPQMSGPELADRLALLHPEMRVFFMSGYPDNDLASYGVLKRSQTLIFKPFRPMDLIKQVREFLDTPLGQ